MKKISSLLHQMPKLPSLVEKNKGITNERQLILRDFLDRLNSDRKPPYKPLQAPRLGKMMQYMSVSEMKQFYANCADAKNFSAFFFWSFKQVK